jgi:hypothetical protein
MPRRNLTPLVLVGALAVLALLFAFVGASSAPGAASLIVQNATGATFGSPVGTTSFSMSLVDSIAAATGSASISQTRLVRYVPSGRMTVYQVTASGSQVIAVLGGPASQCALTAYTSIVTGPARWTAAGNGTYTRTESLADYTGRVPYATGTTCSPRPSTVHGTVTEAATVKSGYLTALHLSVMVPPQTLANGKAAPHGVEGEDLNLVKINGTATSSLG